MDRDLPMIGIGIAIGGALSALVLTLAPSEPADPTDLHTCYEDEIQWVTPTGIMCHAIDNLPPGALPDDGRPADYHHETDQ